MSASSSKSALNSGTPKDRSGSTYACCMRGLQMVVALGRGAVVGHLQSSTATTSRSLERLLRSERP